MFHRLKVIENACKTSPFTLFPLHLSRLIRKATCWKCGTENAKELYCKKCNVLQEPDDKSNYFDLLDIKLSYDVNHQDLVSKYHKMQIVFHPDKHSNKTEKERQISEAYSSLINKAYATLSNPLQRGQYLLQLQGSQGNEESTSSSDQELFLEILELNEEIELVCDRKQALEINEKLNEIILSLTSEISRAFEENDFKKAQSLLNKMKYYTTAMNKLKATKQQKDIPD